MKVIAFIRSVIYWIAFVIILITYGSVLFISIPFTSRQARYAIVRAWCKAAVNLMKWICGVNFEFTGLQNIPREGPLVLLSKHQSGWETLALTAYVPRRLSYVYKRELHKIPVFGWGLASLGMFSIDRSHGKAAFEKMKVEVPKFFAKGWALILFPEGTRTKPGQTVKYKTGGVRIASDTNAPIIPVALNSGEFWPKHSFCIYPGTVKVIFGPQISPVGKTAQQLNDEVQNWIESEQRKISPQYYQ